MPPPPPPPPPPPGAGVVVVVVEVVVVGVGGATGLLGGEYGTVANPLGVTTLEGSEFGLLPTLLLATTVNSYGIPLASPEIAHLVPLVTHVLLSGCEVTMYLLIGDPPFDLGDDHFRTARAFPAVACTARTALGTVVFASAAEAGNENANERAKELPTINTTLVQRACSNVFQHMFANVSLVAGARWPAQLEQSRPVPQVC